MRRLTVLAGVLTAFWLVWRGLLPWLDAPPQITLPTPPVLPTGPIDGMIDRIVIDKTARLMVAFQNGQPVRRYDIGLGFAPDGHKERQGDGRTPEGIYQVDRRNDRSLFHLSLGIDYPRAEDRARARALGVDPGGDIFIHGQPNGRVARGYRIRGDWTEGCIAVSDAEIEELFAATPIGTVVEIRP